MDIQGKPMVIRVAERCVEAIGHDLVLVSTPDLEIRDACEKHGIQSIASSSSCESGTDRLVEYAQKSNEDFIINVQGDEPMIPTSVILKFYNNAIQLSKTCIGVSRIFDDKSARSSSVVKTAFSRSRLIYASREPIPVGSEDGRAIYYKHTGIYAFTRSDLLIFGNYKRGPLEISENVEILRLIENGIEVCAIEIPNYGRAVDTLEDLDFVNKYGKFENQLL
jgi:3-deoxy-manno-octulosonate cytidylyltransferase (CMP-KDO synthetase)